MTDPFLSIVRVFHVLGVVIWIGGVTFVTTVILPISAKLPRPEEGAAFFERTERRFAWIARAAILIVGASGLYMVRGFDLWDRFTSSSFWWMRAMVAVWSIFAVLLFFAEPLFLHRLFSERMQRDPAGAFKLVQRGHWLLLMLSLITVAGAVAGVHG